MIAVAAEHGEAGRWAMPGYAVALFAGMLKFYPVTC